MYEEKKSLEICLPPSIWREIRSIGLTEIEEAKRNGQYTKEIRDLIYYEGDIENNKGIIEDIIHAVGVKKLIREGLKYEFIFRWKSKE